MQWILILSDKKSRVERRLAQRKQEKLMAEIKKKRNHTINAAKKKKS
jgi:hypothetical protein